MSLYEVTALMHALKKRSRSPDEAPPVSDEDWRSFEDRVADALAKQSNHAPQTTQ